MVLNAANEEKKLASRSGSQPGVKGIFEDIIGCKWTLHVLAQIRSGANRPGAIVRSLPGLTTKVMNERLRKMLRFGILRKKSFPEVPPRVEYRLTSLGERMGRILDELSELERDYSSVDSAPRGLRAKHRAPASR